MACSVVQNIVASKNVSEDTIAFDTTAASEYIKGNNVNLPTVLKGPLLWSGVDFKNEENYTCHLSKEDIEEINTALDTFKTLGLDGDEVAQSNFPLPNLASRLASYATAIHGGHGFFVLKGLDNSRYSVEDGVTIYLGLSSYIADKRGLQDRKGNVLSHITNSKQWSVPAEQRHGIHSNFALPFHNDMGCDILALQARHNASNGGHTYLSSVWTAFNKLLSEEPSVAKTLLAPDWPVQISGRNARYYLAPALIIHEGKLMASMDPNRFGPHPSNGPADIPNLTPSQKYALEKLSNTAKLDELKLKLETGDILFFNNWALLHRRDAYEDDNDSSRHLVRLWLRNSKQGWSVPSSFLPPWLAAYGDDKTQDRLYPLMPMPEYKVPKYSAGSAAFMIEDSDVSDNE